jgi:NAD(P)-dependent dehydrogenase (short-subunit alcohol dehydrogenase family)
MSDFEKKFPFTEDEWETCLKVLSSLKDDPLNNPDNDFLKSLLQKIAKKARKVNRKMSYAEKVEADLVIQKQSVIVSNALAGISVYSSEDDRLNKSPLKLLNMPKNCYCCNATYQLAHFFYNRVCPACAVINYDKRSLDKDLSGMTAVVTGCRVKVGYATVLKLLRNGADVIGTSRFPASALEQYQNEADFDDWKGRLNIYGLDLRVLKEIEQFVSYVDREFKQLDMLVNNAAQTIKYPDEYYRPLISSERELLKLGSPRCLPNPTPIGGDLKQLASEIALNEGEPLNRFSQPVDHRDKTSWNSTLSEIGLVELIEVNLINQIAPFLLIQSFKKMMERTDPELSFVINVTSTEGLFSHANKTHCHPHTNMTKASLNMITRTSSEEFSESNILMNSVDVGWISTGAREELRREQFEKAYVPPLDSVDGASRILDPVYRALDGDRNYGKLFKDYKVHEW